MSRCRFMVEREEDGMLRVSRIDTMPEGRRVACTVRISDEERRFMRTPWRHMAARSLRFALRYFVTNNSRPKAAQPREGAV